MPLAETRPRPIAGAAFKPRLNVLTAFPYVKEDIINDIRQLGDDCRWLVDSGAFTAFKAGKPVKLDDYCRFLETLPVKPWRYFTLDVIGDPEASARNYEIMRSRGFNPVPIFTRGEQLSALDAYFETSDMVGLGGVAGADKAAYAWTRQVMEHVGPRHVHILGFTSMNWLKFLRPYSCDSSTWENGAIFGAIPVYLGQGRMDKIDRATLHKGPLKPEIAAAIRRLGFDPAALRTPEAWIGNDGAHRWIGGASWIACAIEFERMLGTRLFLVLMSGRGELLRSAFNSVAGRVNGEQLRLAAVARKKAAKG